MLISFAAISFPEFFQKRRERSSEYRNNYQCHQRHLHRYHEEEREIADHERAVLERRRDYLRENEPRLRRVRDDAGENLSCLCSLEKTERQVNDVIVNSIAQITGHVLLQARPKLSCNPAQKILDQDQRNDDEDDVPERSHLVIWIEQEANRLRENSRKLVTAYSERRLIEKGVEKRDQQGERKCIENR